VHDAILFVYHVRFCDGDVWYNHWERKTDIHLLGQDISHFENGIGPLDFKSLRLISFPGGQQYGAISPCEMNEFSSECEEWETENGPYVKGKYMVNSNDRTKGR
jgi:hypothetical protein